MSLIVQKAGWETDPETGAEVFAVQLIAEAKEDVGDLTAGDIWHQRPMVLMRASEYEDLRRKDSKP